MLSAFLRFLILLPFEIFGRIMEIIFHPEKDYRARRRYSTKNELIEEIVYLRRKLRDAEYRHKQDVNELRDRHLRELEKVRRQRKL